MNGADKTARLTETVCVVEEECMPDFIRIMTTCGPVRDAVFKHLNFKDFSRLNQAVQLSKACSEFQQILLYEGAFRIVPHKMDQLQYIAPFIEGEHAWNRPADDNEYAKMTSQKFKILRIISYQARRYYYQTASRRLKYKVPL